MYTNGQFCNQTVSFSVNDQISKSWVSVRIRCRMQVYVHSVVHTNLALYINISYLQVVTSHVMNKTLHAERQKLLMPNIVEPQE